MINYSDLHKRIKRSPTGSRSYVLGRVRFRFSFFPVFFFFFVIFNLVAEQLLSRAIYVIIPPQQLLRKCQANYSPVVNVRIGTQTNLWNVWDTLLPSQYRRATSAVYNVRIYCVRPLPSSKTIRHPSPPSKTERIRIFIPTAVRYCFAYCRVRNADDRNSRSLSPPFSSNQRPFLSQSH